MAAAVQIRPLRIHHQAVRRGVGDRDGLVPPVRRGFEQFLRLGHGSAGLYRNGDLAKRVLHRIQNRHEIRAVFVNAVDEAVGIGTRIPAIHRNFIVEIFFRSGPIPLGDHDVAFHALRARRSRRQFAVLDAIGPVGVFLHGALAAHTCCHADHKAADLG